ncbi:MAG TPA: type II toxin-antitoxin system death-on-curing family toxin [Candidatus Saccharimonadales bacterium]|nr:type II toxin-antitoxin system death-on-curing family toxin [Candidatus Saccharimonadales bacterium]
MKYLTPHKVIQIHFELVEATGGLQGLRDLGLLESAVSRPQASFGGKDLYPSLILKAAALVHSLLLNHVFADGNKRTATISMIEFLTLNGKKINMTNKEMVDFALWVENKRPELEEIAAWIKKHRS